VTSLHRQKVNCLDNHSVKTRSSYVFLQKLCHVMDRHDHAYYDAQQSWCTVKTARAYLKLNAVDCTRLTLSYCSFCWYRKVTQHSLTLSKDLSVIVAEHPVVTALHCSGAVLSLPSAKHGKIFTVRLLWHVCSTGRSNGSNTSTSVWTAPDKTSNVMSLQITHLKDHLL